MPAAGSAYLVVWIWMQNIHGFFFISSILLTLFLVYLIFNHVMTKIILDEYYITYKRWWYTKTFTYSEIMRIEAAEVLEGFSDLDVKPGRNIIISTYDDSIWISISRFSRKVLKEVANSLIANCKNAKIDEDVFMLARRRVLS